MARWTGKQKLDILRGRLTDGPSDSCAELGIQISLLHYWQRLLFTRGAVVFTVEGEDDREQVQMQIADLEAECSRYDHEILALTKTVLRHKRKSWGVLTGGWVAPEVRHEVVEVVTVLVAATELPIGKILGLLKLRASRFDDWQTRYGPPPQ